VPVVGTAPGSGIGGICLAAQGTEDRTKGESGNGLGSSDVKVPRLLVGRRGGTGRFADNIVESNSRMRFRPDEQIPTIQTPVGPKRFKELVTPTGKADRVAKAEMQGDSLSRKVKVWPTALVGWFQPSTRASTATNKQRGPG